MLTSLAIRNVVLIEALDLAFGPGLGVLTGETGAGKSILLDALGLVLGNRAETGLVRAGEEQASVTATFEFAELPEAMRAALAEAEVEIEPGEPLILRRRVKCRRRLARRGSTTSRSAPRCCASWRRRWSSCTASTTTAGWSTRAATARCSTATPASDVAGVEDAWAKWRAAEAALDAARARHRAGQGRPGPAARAPRRADRARARGRRGGAARAARAPTCRRARSSPATSRRCGWCGTDRIRRWRSCAARRGGSTGSPASMPLLAEALAALDRAVIEAGEAEEKLEKAAEALTFDPAELDRIETRLFELRALARKHGCQPDELPATMRELRAQLDAIEAGDAEIGALERRRSEAGAGLSRAAPRRCTPTASPPRCGSTRRWRASWRRSSSTPRASAPRSSALPEERWGAHGHRRGRVPDRDQPRAPTSRRSTRSPAAASCRASSSRSRSRWPSRAGRRR